MPKHAPNPNKKQHCKDCMVRNDEESEAACQLDPDVTKGPLYMTFGDVYCRRTLVYANPNPVIEEKIQRNVKYQFD